MTTQPDQNSRPTQQTWKTTRAHAMGVPCPKCSAKPRMHCWGAQPGAVRKSCHQERHDEAIRLGAPASLHGRP